MVRESPWPNTYRWQIEEAREIKIYQISGTGSFSVSSTNWTSHPVKIVSCVNFFGPALSCDCIIQRFTGHSVNYPSEFLIEHLCTQVITLNKYYRDHGNGDEVPAIKDHACTKLAICFLTGISKSPPLPVKDIYYFLEQLGTLSHLIRWEY